MQFFLQNLMNGISLGILYAIAAIGFVMIYRTSHILNFAHGGLMAMGAFIFLALSSWGRLPMIFALLLTLTGVFAIGLMIEKGFHRTFMASKPIHGAILTIGLALIFKSLFTFLSEMKPSGYSEYVCETLSIRWGTFTIPAPSVAIFILGVVLFVLFGLFLKYSSLGIYVRSIAENRSAALALGIPIKRVLALSWATCSTVLHDYRCDPRDGNPCEYSGFRRHRSESISRSGTGRVEQFWGSHLRGHFDRDIGSPDKRICFCLIR